MAPREDAGAAHTAPAPESREETAGSGETTRSSQVSDQVEARVRPGGPESQLPEDDAHADEDAGMQSATRDSTAQPSDAEPSAAQRGESSSSSEPVESPAGTGTSAKIGAPELLGVLAGPGVAQPPDVDLYGTDLGYTYEHQGRLYMLFGDSMRDWRFYCDEHDPFEDDAMAILPLEPVQGVPRLDFLAEPEQRNQYATMRVTRDGEPIPMGLSRTAATAWSDGEHAIAMIGHIQLTHCASGSTGSDGCDESAGFSCVRDIGRCEPAVGDSVRPCGPGGSAFGGCGLGQNCVIPEDGFCVDLTCSQYDGTDETVPFAITRNSDFAVQREDTPNVFDIVHTFVSKKFHSSVARTVTRIADSPEDDDYTPGHGTLLLWGRPGFFGEAGGQAQVYLLKHDLPLDLQDGRLAFEPDYFAGVDAATGVPLWSSSQRDAVGLAMDGKVGGDPSDTLLIPNAMGVSWVGAPVNKWVMLYGGDIPDVLLLDANSQRDTRGPIRVRFADRPWGPWTPAQIHLDPGSPKEPGALYGPGGFLYHNECVDQAGMACAKTDPVRPADSYLPGCPMLSPQLDIGRMYGVNIIDAYTRTSGSGLDIAWNVSTWNPYAVLLLRSHIELE